MKIAFVDSRLNLKNGGGSNHSLHITASQLTRLGHEVVVLTLLPHLNAFPDHLPYRVISNGLALNRFDRKYRLAFMRALHRYESHADIFHLWEPWLCACAGLYRMMGGKVPMVTYLNNYHFCSSLGSMDTMCSVNCGLIQQVHHRPENVARKLLSLPFRAAEHWLEKLAINSTDAFIAISPATADIYASHGFDPRKIKVIPPAIDYESLHRLRQHHESRPWQREDVFNVLFVGRLTREKGVDLLLDAVATLRFAVSLDIVGDGPEKEFLQRLSQEVGLSKLVRFHGWIPSDRLPEFYLRSNVFVHPGRWPEPLGRTILDAMAFGVPVLVSNTGGPPWAIDGAGLVFHPGSVEDLAQKIELLHSNPSMAAVLAARATERAKDFDYGKAIPKLLDLYGSIARSSEG